MSDDMLKVLWPAQTATILNDGLSSIGGPVVRATDLRSTDPAALLSAWGWADLAPYGSPPEVVDVLRFPMHPMMRTRTPTPSTTPTCRPTPMASYPRSKH
jgi:hypothetical protein